MTGMGQFDQFPFAPTAEFPEDCGQESDFLLRVYDSVQEVSSNGLSGRTVSRVFLTLLTYCYARGVYSSEQIELSAETDSTIRYICVNDLPQAADIRAFRRNHKAAIIWTLSAVLESMPSKRRISALASRREALRRVGRAIQQDSIELDV